MFLSVRVGAGNTKFMKETLIACQTLPRTVVVPEFAKRSCISDLVLEYYGICIIFYAQLLARVYAEFSPYLLHIRD